MLDKAKIGFIYSFECYDPEGKLVWEHKVKNLLPESSVAYLLGAALAGGSQLTSWYIGLWTAAHVPAGTDTMTTVVTTAVEATAYAGTERPAFTPDAIAGGVFANVGAPTEITFNAPTTIRGGFITSNITRGNTGGLLLSEVALPSPEVVKIGNVLKVTAGLSLVSI
ncbi:MAG TPA: hypothetical protein DCZ63_15170 [Geobacter sp.]|nr:hypothetical protein [Geobacter sp.]